VLRATGFVTNELAYRERLGRMIAMSDIIKVPEEDLAWMEPGGGLNMSPTTGSRVVPRW